MIIAQARPPGQCHRRSELLVLLCIGIQYHAAFIWLVRTWCEATYESWGALPLLLLVPRLLRPPPMRAVPSFPHLLGLLALAVLDLLCAPLRLNVLFALLGLISLHLWAVAFRELPGRWYRQPQLWLALLSLPAVHWANVLFGYQLQHLVTRLAAGGLALYGLPVSSQGTLLGLPGMVLAVDTACSGLKLLYAGLLLGILASPRPAAARARAVFWLTLLVLLLLANVVRVMSLAVAHLQLGRPVSDSVHQCIGLLAFAMVCAAALALARALARRDPPCRASRAVEVTP